MTDALIISFLVVTAVWLIGIYIFRRNPLMIGLVCIAYIGVIMFYVLPMSAVDASNNGSLVFQNTIQDSACRQANQCLNKT